MSANKIRQVVVALVATNRFLKQREISMGKTNADLVASIANAKKALADQQQRANDAAAAAAATIAAQQSHITDLQNQNAALQTALDSAADTTSEVADVDAITAALETQFAPVQAAK